MVSDWFEKDNFKQTVRQLLIDALKEIKVDFLGWTRLCKPRCWMRQRKSVFNVHCSRS